MDGSSRNDSRKLDDMLFASGEIEGFDGTGLDDDLDFIDKEEMARDQFMEDLNQGYEPNSELLAPFRIPVENQNKLNINSDRESLQEVTSDDSEQADKLSEDSDKDK